MTIHLSIVVFLPLAAGVLGLLLPRPFARWAALAGALAVLAVAVGMIADFSPGAQGLRYRTDIEWIPALGIHYSLGIDGLNLFLVALTAALWAPATLAAAFREWERPRQFFFHLMLGETAVLGAFMAQDLALFVAFFDLMLVPFYFLVGAWGGPNRVAATTKLVIYTLVGSLLMLVGAVALGVLATPDGGQISFALADLRARTLPVESQKWIFLVFAAAFLVKAPVFPVHGWLPDAYRATPGPVLALLSGVLSKVGVYGFLRIVLPVLPDASVHFQEAMLVLAVVSILYGSVLAFSQDEARLVVGYSSIAQLGFIVLGIFALDPKGAQGAVMQMVTHGLVACALFLIIPVLAARAGGSDSLARMGGIALRAPVLATMFLIVTFATLAMPGSPNFVGELLILFGAFEQKLVYGLVASVGVVLAAVYMIRVFQQSMHNRVGPAVESREISRPDLAALAPVVLAIVALGVYPQLILGRTEPDATAPIQRAAERAGVPGAAAWPGFATYAPIGGDEGPGSP
ncbi:MAG: NADH-quinone oxidoreductase subunit M, partial [Actinomycetota bacterium]|nr:NADH-quinone oxidoreductase subunit M [Actinomycetota bacterium]